MPIYEYECRKCKAHTEAFQKVTDKPLTKCPKCGGRLEKRISAPAIQFKGSGWYVTDYAGKGKATKESDKTSETTTEAKSDKSDKPDKTEKSDTKAPKESSPAKKTSEKASPPKSSGD